MTDSNLTLIASLLDRSGSMESSRAATQDGFDELINGQRSEPGQAQVTLAQFDRHEMSPVPEWVYRNMPIADVPKLQLLPRGMTPLLDATGVFITQIGEDLAALPEDKRPGLVICLLMTDGHENASLRWSWATVKDLITRQREQYNWKFIFLGANIDAVKVAADIGIPTASAMQFDSHDYASNVAAYAAPGVYTSAARGAALAGEEVMDAAFTDEQRDEAMGGGRQPNESQKDYKARLKGKHAQTTTT